MVVYSTFTYMHTRSHIYPDHKLMIKVLWKHAFLPTKLFLGRHAPETYPGHPPQRPRVSPWSWVNSRQLPCLPRVYFLGHVYAGWFMLGITGMYSCNVIFFLNPAITQIYITGKVERCR